MKRVWWKALCAVSILAAGSVAQDEGAAPIEAKAAFEQLKSLVGTWQGEFAGQPYTVKYRLVGNGTALVEEEFVGTPHEMVTIYHLDGPELRLTHYCAAGNQPRMRLDRAASRPGSLKFAFDGGSNLDASKDMHMHEGQIVWKADDQIESTWTPYRDGKPLEAHSLILKRQ